MMAAHRLPVRTGHPVPLAHRVLRALLPRTAPWMVPLARAHRNVLLARVTLVALTGAVGKTTTAACIAAALGLPRRPSGDNAFPNLLLNLLRIRPWQARAVVETGIDGPGQMARIARLLRPDVAVFTAVGPSHCRSFRELADTAAEKSLLLAHLRPGGVAVLNADDREVMATADRAPGRVVTYGFAPDADVRALSATPDWPHGTRLRVRVGGRTIAVRTRLFGRRMAYAALAALAVAHALDEPLEEAAARLAAVTPAPMRLEAVGLPSGAWLLRDEFRSNLETIDAALDLLEEIPGRRLAIMGDIAEPPQPHGPVYWRVGARLAAVCDRIVVVGSRSLRQRLVSGARKAGYDAARFLFAGNDWRRAVAAIAEDLGPGDVVLVKGRNEQCLARASLALAGRVVRCGQRSCRLRDGHCDGCPRLEREDTGA